jgi:hypothetical protein
MSHAVVPCPLGRRAVTQPSQPVTPGYTTGTVLVGLCAVHVESQERREPSSSAATVATAAPSHEPAQSKASKQSGKPQGTKRARTAEPGAPTSRAAEPSAGRPQLLLVKTELQSWPGKKYCDEADLLGLLLAHGIVRP